MFQFRNIIPYNHKKKYRSKIIKKQVNKKYCWKNQGFLKCNFNKMKLTII